MDNKLLNILNKSKMIMNELEDVKGVQQKPKYNSNIDHSYYDDDYDEDEVAPQMNEQVNYGVPASKNLPKEILDAMLNNPIPTINEVLDLHNPIIQASKMMEQQLKPKPNPNRNQQRNDDYVLVSKTELKNIMLETLLEFMPKITTNIEESAIKKTIQVIIKENKEKKGRL